MMPRSGTAQKPRVGGLTNCATQRLLDISSKRPGDANDCILGQPFPSFHNHYHVILLLPLCENAPTTGHSNFPPSKRETNPALKKREKTGFEASGLMLIFLLGTDDVTQTGVALVVTLPPADGEGRGWRRERKWGRRRVGWVAEGEGRGSRSSRPFSGARGRKLWLGRVNQGAAG